MKAFNYFCERRFTVVFLLFFSTVTLVGQPEIQWKESALSFDESAGTVDVTLVRSVTGELSTVLYRTVESTAVSGVDFQAITNRQAIFTSSKEEITISLTINQDVAEEGQETFLLQLISASSGSVIGSNKDLIITINDDDVASIEWKEGFIRINEDATSVEVTAIRSGGAGTSLTVDYETIGGTATPIFDFQSRSGTLSFLAGEIEKSVSINLTNDTLLESDEEFSIQLSDPSKGELGAQSQARVIIEDDESSSGTIGWSVASIRNLEGAVGVDVVVERTGGSQGNVSVNYASSDLSAIAGVDYVSLSGSLIWGNGSTTPRTVTVTLLEDATEENDESFEIVLSGVIGGAELGDSRLIVEIQDNDDDDPSLPGKIGFSMTLISVKESVGSVEIAVSRTGGSAGFLEVDYRFTDGGATRDSDFTGVDGSLIWADGDAADKVISVPIVDDGSFELDEDFLITLEAENSEILNDVFSVGVVIQNDDTSNTGTVVFESGGQIVSEDGKTVSVVVQRVGGATGSASVNYETQAGTALAGVDYLTQVGVINWDDGDDQDKVISLNLIDDDLFEGNETYSITLNNVNGGGVAGANSLHVITIADNELQPGTWFEFNRVLYSGTEGSGQVTIQVERFGDGIGAASVTVQSDNGTATGTIDFAVLNTSLSWPDGDLEPKAVDLIIFNDSLSEQNERVTLALTNPSDNSLVGNLNEAEALIYDDDGETGELLNLSTRGFVGENDDVLIGGFIIFNASQKVLIRAVGPSLTGVAGVLPDPSLQIINNENQTVVYENDNWTDDISQIQPIIDSGLGGLNTNESAVLKELPPGSYSAIVSGNGQSGIGAIEIYVDRSAGLTGDLVNISTRGRISSGEEILIGGLIIGGDHSKRLLFRGMGPSLVVPGASSIADPELLLFNNEGQVIDSNDNWMEASNWDEIEATLFAPMDSESAMLLELVPGIYTLHLRSVGFESGIGSVEIYTLN